MPLRLIEFNICEFVRLIKNRLTNILSLNLFFDNKYLHLTVSFFWFDLVEVTIVRISSGNSKLIVKHSFWNSRCESRVFKK